jgi:hypothetical protein
MARRYSATGDQTAASTATLLGIASATTVKPAVYDVLVGSDATPADTASQFSLSRFTVAGTGTAVSELPLDPDDPASLATAQSNHTAEPTYTAGEDMLVIDLNQRATLRWVAAPGSEIYMPATAANGLGFRFVSTGQTGDSDVTILWIE